MIKNNSNKNNKKSNSEKNKNQLKIRFKKTSEYLKPKISFFKNKFEEYKNINFYNYLNVKESRFGNYYKADLRNASIHNLELFNYNSKNSLDFLKYIKDKYKFSSLPKIPESNSIFKSNTEVYSFFKEIYGYFSKSGKLNTSEKIILKMFNLNLKLYLENSSNLNKLYKHIEYINHFNKKNITEFINQQNLKKIKLKEEAKKEYYFSRSLDSISSEENKYQQKIKYRIISELNSKIEEINNNINNFNINLKKMKNERKELNILVSNNLKDIFARTKVLNDVLREYYIK
ncbi:MAG: hypothetical protein PHN22_02215 [Candidatus ainarchaeum sp.]|nr:hypothetical protein [Candidatus ainarchaeum sp.]